MSEFTDMDIFNYINENGYNLLEEISDKDIKEYVEDHSEILSSVYDCYLIDALTFPSEALDRIETDDILKEMEKRGYVLKEDNSEEDHTKKYFKYFIRSLKPRGILMADDLKRLVNDFIDDNIHHSFDIVDDENNWGI